MTREFVRANDAVEGLISLIDATREFVRAASGLESTWKTLWPADGGGWGDAHREMQRKLDAVRFHASRVSHLLGNNAKVDDDLLYRCPDCDAERMRRGERAYVVRWVAGECSPIGLDLHVWAESEDQARARARRVIVVCEERGLDVENLAGGGLSLWPSGGLSLWPRIDVEGFERMDVQFRSFGMSFASVLRG